MSYLSSIIGKKEYYFLSFISIILAFNSYFFVERKSTNAFPLIFDQIAIHYIIYLLSGLAVCLIFFFYHKKESFFQHIHYALIVFLPMELTLIYNLFFLHTETKVHYLFYIFTGAYLIIASLYFIEKKAVFSMQKKICKEIIRDWFKDQSVLYVILLILSMSTFGYFGISHIGNYAGVDEPLWTFDRIPSFWKNVGQRDWKNTSISDKPGITVAAISGIGLLYTDPLTYKNLTRFDDQKDVRDMNRAFRLPLVIFCLISIFFFYIIIQELLNKHIAIISVIFISTSPMLIGMSRIINPDAILWIFASLTIMTYMIFLQKNTRFWLYAAGILLGLSLLTKYVTNIIYVFFFVLIFVNYLFIEEKTLNNTSIHKYLKNAFINFFSVTFISLITFYTLFPETWIDPKKLFTGTILSQAFISVAPLFISILFLLFIDTIFLNSKIISPIIKLMQKRKNVVIITIVTIFAIFTCFTFLNTYLSMNFVDFEEILTSPKTSYKTSSLLTIFSANFYPLLFASLPIVVLGVLFSLISMYKNYYKKTQTKKVITHFILFILLYYIGATFNGVVSIIRYQVILYPLLLIIASIGFYELITDWFPSKKKKILLFGTAITFLVIGSFTLHKIAPFYLGYASTLLPDRYIVDTKDMGDGSYEAATFLNTLPHAEDLFVWTDKKGLCTFFVGKCDSFYDRDSFEQNTIDYFVLSSGRKSKFISIMANRSHVPYDFQKMYDSSDTEFSLFIGGRPGNYVKILSADKFRK